MDNIVFKVSNLSKQFGRGCEKCKVSLPENVNYCSNCHTVYAVKNVTFDLYENEIIGIVGESGSGKSTLVQCLYFDVDPTSGAAYIPSYSPELPNVFLLSNQNKIYIKNHLMGMVYQNPYLGLKMHFSAISNIAEKMIAASNRTISKMNAVSKNLLRIVQIPEERHKDLPLYFSGGMQQRVQIAKALSNEPPILLLDEITTGLDLSVQANVLDLIKQIKRDTHVSMIVVSHDLSVIRMLTDRTLVMYQGTIVEQGLTDQILEDPQHPYTQQLVSAML